MKEFFHFNRIRELKKKNNFLRELKRKTIFFFKMSVHSIKTQFQNNFYNIGIPNLLSHENHVNFTHLKF